jgi:hypothetical protein
MRNETVETRVARLEEQMQYLFKQAEETHEAQAVQLKATEGLQLSINKVSTSILQMTNSIATMNGQLAAHAPTIEEFLVMKQKVQGAGILGKWLWGAGAVLITILYTSREMIFHIFSRAPN